MSDPIMEPTDTTKPGWQTSEFWIMLAFVVAATFLVHTGKLSAEWWGATVAGVVGVYTGVRGFVRAS